MVTILHQIHNDTERVPSEEWNLYGYEGGAPYVYDNSCELDAYI